MYEPVNEDSGQMLTEVFGYFFDAPGGAAASVEPVGDAALPSCFRTTDLAVASIGAAAWAVNCLSKQPIDQITVDRTLASLWFDRSVSPVGWDLPPVWGDIAGVYQTADGWIRLHTNADHHRQAALDVLRVTPDREAVTNAVSDWNAEELETAIVGARGCAAQMLSQDAWRSHPQGKIVHTAPLVEWNTQGWVKPDAQRHSNPLILQNVRILDLTRVLAGPVASRFLAGYGAEVLRIDSPRFDDSANAPEMSLGKRRAQLDLRKTSDNAKLLKLLEGADVVIHGYRADALDRLGIGESARRRSNAKLIDVALNAYGWQGPWKNRRGFDSLVQMSSGIAWQGGQWAGDSKPNPLPVQALDHATGYLMAAAVLAALKKRRQSGEVTSARLSLGATAAFLSRYPSGATNLPAVALQPAHLVDQQEATAWGEIQRVQYPVRESSLQPDWRIPAGHFGVDAPAWLQ